MKVTAEFVISAASTRDLPQDGLSEVALVGRSNVGKSSLINALVRQRVARTSAAPGKTRLANIYRVVRGGGSPLYLVDLPGYGYARGGRESAREFAALTRGYFEGDRRTGPPPPRSTGPGPADAEGLGLLVVDARHPGLPSDVDAWAWLRTAVPAAAIVATKIDKLARGERIRAIRELESVFHEPVLPVSAVTGEGLDELWKLIDRLANSHTPPRRSNSSPPPPKATARRPARNPPRRQRR